MPNAREPAGDRPRLSALIVFALREGWKVSRPSQRRIVLSKTGLPPIYCGLPCDGERVPPRSRRDAAATPGSGGGKRHV